LILKTRKDKDEKWKLEKNFVEKDRLTKGRRDSKRHSIVDHHALPSVDQAGKNGSPRPKVFDFT